MRYMLTCKAPPTAGRGVNRARPFMEDTCYDVLPEEVYGYGKTRLIDLRAIIAKFNYIPIMHGRFSTVELKPCS